jgi:hypothetical protein
MAYSSRPTVGATRARQGRLGRHVFWVLLFGTLLAALGLFAAWTWNSDELGSSTADNGAASKSAEAQVFDAPEPAPINPQPAQKAQTPARPGPST